MADYEWKQEQKRKKNKRKLRSTKEEGPCKASRIDQLERESDEQKEEAEEHVGTSEILEDGSPWSNLQLILSLQSKNINLERKIELVFDYVKSRVSKEEDDVSQGLEMVSVSRVIVFLNNWVQSLFISSEKKLRAEENTAQSETLGSCLDHRCWEIFKFCLEESFKLHIPLSFSRDLLQVIRCIAKDAYSRLNVASSHSKESVLSGKEFELYRMVLRCISLVFSSHGGVSNDNLDLWVLTVHTILELVQKIFNDKLDGGNEGIFVLQLSCFVLEPFVKFLRVHPTRKNGFRDFIDKLLEPLLHLLDVLHLYIGGCNPEWTRNLLNLVEEVLSQGLFHPVNIDGFLSLQSTAKYKTSDDGKPEDLKTVIKSYHRHLFDKLEKIIAGKNALALGGMGELFRLFVDCVKKQKGVSVSRGGSMLFEDVSIGHMFKGSSRSSSLVPEKINNTISVSAETRKSLFDFFVQIMEPLLLEIRTYLQSELEVGPLLLDIHSTLKSTNKILVSFIHENVHVRMEDMSDGACVDFLKKVYDMIMSFSVRINQLWSPNSSSDKKTHGEVFNLIAKELIVAVRYLVDIEYEIVGDDLESLWLMMLSHAALGYFLMDVPNQSLTSEIHHLGCQLVDLYSELRQVNNSIFALCRAVRRLVLPVRSAESTLLHYESYVKSSRMVLCSLEFRLSVYNAIKSIPEGQASGCIQHLTADISQSLEWMKAKSSMAAGNEHGKVNLHSFSSTSYKLQVELLGRGLSEVYTLILDSLTVTPGNSYLIGVSMMDLMAIIRPSLSCLVAPQPDNINEFLSAVTGRTFSKGAGLKNGFLSTHWVFLFFFRLYMSCRSVCRQAISLVPPDTSRKMSGVIGDSFTAFSGRDWLERTTWTDDGYFSWIVQPSASLLTIIQVISDFYLQDSVADCSSLIYILNSMALQRLVDLNRLIKSFEYLLQRDNILAQTKLMDDAGLSQHRKKTRKWKKFVSDLRQEAAGLTNFIMGYLPLVANGELSICSSDDATHKDTSTQDLHENDAWDSGVGAVSEKTLPSAIWCIICQNIDIWCPHAAKKMLKRFLLILIKNSFPSAINSLDDYRKESRAKFIHPKKVTACQISLELLRDTVLYEQEFVRRHMASRFCWSLEKSVLPIFSDFGEVELNSPPDWPEFLSALEKSLIVILDNKDDVNDCSSGADPISHSFNHMPLEHCNGEESSASMNVEFTTCQSLLNYLCWMPKGYLSSRSFSLYATCILNLERLVVARLLDWHGALFSHYHYELLRLFLSCRRALRNLIMASCEEKMEASQSPLTCRLFESPFPVSWLLKSLSAVIVLQHAFSEDSTTRVKDVMFSLMDHTSYVFLTLSKDQFVHAIDSLVSAGKSCEENSNSAVAHKKTDSVEIYSRPDSSKDINVWKNVVLVAETLKEQTQSLFISLKGSLHNEKLGVFPGAQELTKLSSSVACFQGFLWGVASALDHINAKHCHLKAEFSRWKFETIFKINSAIDAFSDLISYFLLLLEDDQLPRTLSDAQTLPMSECSNDLLHVRVSSCQGSGHSDDTLCEKEQENTGTTRYISASFDIKDDSNRSVGKERSNSNDVDAECILTKTDLFEQQHLRKPLLQGFLRGENLEVAFFIRQLFLASSAILRLKLQVNCTSLQSSSVPILIGISQVLLLEFASKDEVPQSFSFVWLDGVVKFIEELGSHFPSSNPTLSRNIYIKLIDLHLRAIGKCIALQGKKATLASHETESRTKTLSGQMGLSESTLFLGPYYLDEFKARLRMSFKVFIKKPSELHLLSAIQAIERALVGVQEGCIINYEIQTGSSDGGNVSSIVAAGIDCLDLILEFVTGRKRFSMVRRNIQSLLACVFNIILHLQGPKIFYGNFSPEKVGADPDAGSVILMCVEVLTRVSGKHALFQMDTCHVGQSLHIPATLFQNFLQLRNSEAPAQSISSKFSDVKDTKSFISVNSYVVDRQFSIELYAACCRLLCTVLKHHKSDSRRCIALLEDSVCILLHCLEMVDIDPVVRKGSFAWEVQEGVKCACFLRRVYEELRHQKDVYGQHCFQFLSNYIWIYCGYGPLKLGIRREIVEALKPGVYALIDMCSADNLQYLHTVFGEGPCRNTLATLQHDYKLNFQYEGKV